MLGIRARSWRFLFAVLATGSAMIVEGPKHRVLDDDFFFFQAEDGIRDLTVTGVQTCALPIYAVRAYLQRFPNGIFLELGKLSERRLCGAQRKVTVAEQADRQEMPAIQLAHKIGRGSGREKG